MSQHQNYNLRRVSHINTRISDSSGESPVRLRIIQVRDAGMFARMTSEPACQGWTNISPLTVSDARQQIFQLRDELEEGSVYQASYFGVNPPKVQSGPSSVYFSIIEDISNEVVGFVAVISITPTEHDRSIRHGVLGVVIDPQHRRKGYATEALRLLLDWGFTPIHLKGLNISSLTFKVRPEDEAMKNLLENRLRVLDNQERTRILTGYGMNGWHQTIDYTIWPEEWVKSLELHIET